MKSRKRDSKKKPETSPIPRVPGAGVQPLMTTLRETKSMAGSLARSDGLREPLQMDDYRQDIIAHAVDGSSALAPAPIEYTPPAPLAPSAPTAPAPEYAVRHFQVTETETESAAPSDPISRLRTLANRHPRAALVVLAGVALVTTIIYLSTREASTIPLAKLKQQATQLDGQSVSVKGRIGEVFQMGESYAYLLHQGRDTVVVFTRTGHPIPRERVTVTGSVSTGYLDGVPRVAIFESASK